MSLNSDFNEGDYILTVDGLFFAVKGSIHPEELVVAILRYIPDPCGEREISGIIYKRVYNLDLTTDYLKENHPEYVNYIPRLGIELQTVPITNIISHFEPRKRLTSILENPVSEIEEVLSLFVNSLNIPSWSIGITGSLLIGAQNEDSDIDVNVYGHDESRKAYDALINMRETLDWITPLDCEIFNSVLSSRWGDTGLPLGKFSEIESRKVLHGLVLGHEYFVRLLVPDDVYTSKALKNATIRVKIIDDSKAIFNPCIYKVKPVDGSHTVTELKSYRGKFTEQVKTGELVEARGTIEEVMSPDGVFYRLMLGSRGDYLLPAA